MAFSDPITAIQQLSLREGFSVADFGAGSGHYTLAAARKVGDSGKVCAVDIQKELLARLKTEAEREGLLNVHIVWGDIDKKSGSRLAGESMDAVILANVLFQMEHRGVAVEEVKRVLKFGGKVLVVDWKDSFKGVGPEPSGILSPEKAQELFLGNGFVLEKEISESAGDQHYGFIFTKQ